MNATKEIVKAWRVSVYEKHIGIIDEDDCTVASISGGRGDRRTH